MGCFMGTAMAAHEGPEANAYQTNQFTLENV